MVVTQMDPTLVRIREKVAKALLDKAGDGAKRSRVAKRDIAARVGANWGMVHISLKSMQDEGAIRFDHHRLIINKERLQKVAGNRESR